MKTELNLVLVLVLDLDLDLSLSDLSLSLSLDLDLDLEVKETVTLPDMSMSSRQQQQQQHKHSNQLMTERRGTQPTVVRVCACAREVFCRLQRHANKGGGGCQAGSGVSQPTVLNCECVSVRLCSFLHAFILKSSLCLPVQRRLSAGTLDHVVTLVDGGPLLFGDL